MLAVIIGAVVDALIQNLPAAVEQLGAAAVARELDKILAILGDGTTRLAAWRQQLDQNQTDVGAAFKDAADRLKKSTPNEGGQT
jgi:ABC-type transporter Mla subunit MlaD